MHHSTVAYHRLRDLLFARLGGRRCKREGMADLRGEYPPCHELLEIDHVDGREYEVNELGGITRIRRYLKELDAGVQLQVLCKIHNGSDGYSKGQARSGQHQKQRDRRARACAKKVNEEG